MDKRSAGGGGEEVNSDALFVITLPHSRLLKVMSRFLFLAMVLAAFPCIGSILQGPSPSYFDGSELINESDSIDFESWLVLFQDLVHEGQIRDGDRARALILSSAVEYSVYTLGFLGDNIIEIIPESNLQSWGWIPDEKFDIVLMSNSQGAKLIDPLIKKGGILALQLSNTFQEIPNYKIVYIRQFNSTIVVMRKSVEANEEVNSSMKKAPCAMAFEAKKMAALKGLEDALLEPASTKSGGYINKTNFLPDLLGDSLEGYGRRIFITIGLKEEASATMDWFHHNYPKRGQDFVIYNLEAGTNVGLTDWLRKNVREEEYVVMKAGAGVAEEMIKERTVCLVDELFLECNYKNQNGKKNEKTAYWECLALYGRLRDDGVAVHQWWT